MENQRKYADAPQMQIKTVSTKVMTSLKMKPIKFCIKKFSKWNFGQVTRNTQVQNQSGMLSFHVFICLKKLFALKII